MSEIKMIKTLNCFLCGDTERECNQAYNRGRLDALGVVQLELHNVREDGLTLEEVKEMIQKEIDSIKPFVDYHLECSARKVKKDEEV